MTICWSLLQMSQVRLTDLPADVLCKIVSLLPLTDRARLEAVCKQFHHISTECATELKFDLKTAKEAKGILTWLGNLQEIQRPCLQSIHIILYSPHTFTSGGNSQTFCFYTATKLCSTCWLLVSLVCFGHLDDASSSILLNTLSSILYIKAVSQERGRNNSIRLHKGEVSPSTHRLKPYRSQATVAWTPN